LISWAIEAVNFEERELPGLREPPVGLFARLRSVMSRPIPETR
jgi:hypothetical protein